MDTINLKQNHTMSIPQTETLKPKKNWGWAIAKTVVFLIVLAIAVFGVYKTFFTDPALEKLEADYKQASIDLDREVREDFEIIELAKKSQKEVEEAANDKCNKYVNILGYKKSKGLPTEEDTGDCAFASDVLNKTVSEKLGF